MSALHIRRTRDTPSPPLPFLTIPSASLERLGVTEDMVDLAGCVDDTYTSELYFPSSDDGLIGRGPPPEDVFRAQHMARLAMLRTKFAARTAGKSQRSKV